MKKSFFFHSVLELKKVDLFPAAEVEAVPALVAFFLGDLLGGAAGVALFLGDLLGGAAGVVAADGDGLFLGGATAVGAVVDEDGLFLGGAAAVDAFVVEVEACDLFGCISKTVKACELQWRQNKEN